MHPSPGGDPGRRERPVTMASEAERQRRTVDRDEILARVAELYYLQGWDQRAIAEEVGTSRSNVSRLLTEARRRGIVEIRVNRPLARRLELEREFVEQTGIEEALILATRPGLSGGDLLAPVGALAARYLGEHLRDGLAVGVSQGTSLDAMVDALGDARSYAVEIVQLLGALEFISPDLSGHEIGRRLAERLGGSFYYLHAPAIVDSAETRDALLRQPGIAETLKRGASVDIAFVGVGALGVGTSKHLFADAFVTKKEQREIAASGAVGDVCARLFDIEGKTCKVSLDDRVVGVDLAALKRIPRVVAVARGPEKGGGILGALRGGYANVLVTDEVTARRVLELHERTRDQVSGRARSFIRRAAGASGIPRNRA